MQLVSTSALVLLCVAVEVSTPGRGQIPDQSQRVVVQGTYRNADYGFSVAVPRRLRAYAAKPPAPQHGFALDLSKGGKIWVDAEYDVMLEGSTDLLSTNAAKFFSLSNGLKITRNLSMEVEGFPARETVLEGANSKSLNNYVHFLIILRPVPKEVGVVYTIGLSGKAWNAGDEKTFWKIVNSIRFLDVR